MVEVSEFMVSLELAARDRDVTLLSRSEILESAPKSKCDRQGRVEASIRINGSLRKNGVVPDALFGLQFADHSSFFMLEIDRGEMPIERYRNTYRTYFAKKMMTYYEASRQQRQIHDLGLENFRVLTVTTTPARVEKMLNALRTITDGRGSNMFLFADETKLAADHPLNIEWVSGKGELVSLCE